MNSGTLLAGRKATYLRLMSSKTVGLAAAIALIFNSCTGPGLPFTPIAFQQAGGVFTILCYLLFMIISSLSVLFIVESMQAIPGNRHFQGDVEYATMINFYFGPFTHILGQIMLYGALQTNAIQSIVLSSQAIDRMFIDVFKQSCGIAIPGGWYCVSDASLDPPFGAKFMLITVGYLIVFLLTVPLGLVNLDDNMGIQYGAFIISIIMILQWNSNAVFNGLDLSRLFSPDTSDPLNSYGSVLGTVMLNFAVTTIIPSWINIKRKDVNVQQTVWTTMALACSFYILSGVIMGSGFNNIEPNMLVTQLKSKLPLAFPALTKIMVYAFAFVMLIPSIPVNLIVSKDNLVQNQVVSNTVATIISLVLPWIISMPMLLFSGDNMQTFQTWTSLLFVSTSNFIIPIIIFLKCLDFRHRYNADKELSEKQMSLLKRIHFRSESLVQHIETRSQSRLSGITAFAAATATAFSADDGVAEASSSVSNRDSVVTVNSNTELLGVHQSRFLKKKSSEPAWLSEDVPDPDKEDQLDERMGLRRPTLMNGFRTRSTSDTPSTSNSRENRTDGIRTMGRLPNRNNQAKTLNRPRHGTMDIATRSSTVRFAEPLLPSPTDSETFELQETQPELVDQEFELDTSDLDTVGGGEFNASRLMTLPTHPSFKSPAFRSIPKWVGLRGKSVAIFVLTITSLTTLVNLAINLYNLTT